MPDGRCLLLVEPAVLGEDVPVSQQDSRGLGVGRRLVTFPVGDNLGRMTRWLVAMALLTGCATQQAAEPDCKMKWTGQPPVQVDPCTGRGEDLTPGSHWYDYVFGIPLGIVGFYDRPSNAK